MRFSAKVATIEEAKDVTKMILDDLLGSFLSYEMNMYTHKLRIRVWR